MSKMHLGVRPPNEGARRLAWWVWQSCRGNLIVAAKQCGTKLDTLQRLIAGELIPGEELVRPITIGTGDAVGRADWRRDATGGWFDEPASRRLQQAA